MKTVRIFISSVQKELELERAAVAGLISTESTDNRPMFFENRPMTIRTITIISGTGMAASSIAGGSHA